MSRVWLFPDHFSYISSSLLIRSSSDGEFEGPLSESLELELIDGGRRGLAGAWFPCSKLLVVLALAGVVPVAELLLPEPAPTLGGINSDSLDECVGGGLDSVLCSRLELDESAAGTALLDAVVAGCNDELRAVVVELDTAAVGKSAEVPALGNADAVEHVLAADDDDDDDDCC